MSKYQKGDHVKIEVADEQSADREWVWLLVDHCDDEQGMVFGELDSEPLVAADMKRGQQLAVSYNQIRDHRRFD